MATTGAPTRKSPRNNPRFAASPVSEAYHGHLNERRVGAHPQILFPIFLSNKQHRYLRVASMTTQIQVNHTRHVISALDRDQGDALIVGILKPEKYPIFTSWEYAEKKEEKVLETVEAFCAGWESAHSPVTRIWFDNQNNRLLTVCLILNRIHIFHSYNEPFYFQHVRTALDEALKLPPREENISTELVTVSVGPNGLHNNRVELTEKDFTTFNPNFFREKDGSLMDLSWVDEYIDPEEINESMLFLVGPPGTGKTHLARHIAMRDRCDVLTTCDPQCLRLPAFWDIVRSGEYPYVIFDDVDDDLSTRQGNVFVRNLLVSANGLTPPSCRIILTSNQPAIKLDPALVRTQRCFDVIELEPLRRDIAKEIWVADYDRSPEDFEYFFAETKQISPADVVSYAKRTISKRRRRYDPSRPSAASISIR